jgi:hypothetical protein
LVNFLSNFCQLDKNSRLLGCFSSEWKKHFFRVFWDRLRRETATELDPWIHSSLNTSITLQKYKDGKTVTTLWLFEAKIVIFICTIIILSILGPSVKRLAKQPL